LINVWRIAQSDLKLKNYELEGVVFSCFKKREPFFSDSVLTNWFTKFLGFCELISFIGGIKEEKEEQE